MTTRAKLDLGLVVATLALVLGCGAADETRTAREEPIDDSLLNVAGNVNICPHFLGSLVLPQSISAGQTAVIIARAVDPDGDDAALTFDWNASAGTLSETVRSATKYSCTDTGGQVLTVVTKDARDCHVALDIDVACLDE